MNTSQKNLIKSIALPLAVGAVSGIITSGSMKEFKNLNKPPLSPPGWLFPVVWTTLYVLMGLAAYIVENTGNDSSETRKAMIIYYVQLAVNFLWPIFFFKFGNYLFALYWLILLWVLIIATMASFSHISKKSACLLAPYLLWVTFAAYLNYSIYSLN